MSHRDEREVTLQRRDWTDWAALVAMGLLLLFFWDSVALWPLKIVVVLFHELGHAVAAWVTGGEVVDIGLSPRQGGVTRTLGGWRFFILNAGYLGSMLAGVALLLSSRHARTARAMTIFLAASLLLVGILFVRPLVSFGLLFTVLTALAFAAMARWAGSHLTRLVLRGLGVFSLLYALFDVRDDVFYAGPDVLSDATMLAELTHVPAALWGGAWILAGLAVLWLLRKKLV